MRVCKMQNKYKLQSSEFICLKRENLPNSENVFALINRAAFVYSNMIKDTVSRGLF